MDNEEIQENKGGIKLTPNAVGMLGSGGGVGFLDLLLWHGHPAGLFAAGAASWVMGRHTSDFLYMKDKMVAHFVHAPAGGDVPRTLEQSYSFGDRLLGKHLSQKPATHTASAEEKPFLSRLVGGSSNRMVDLAPDLQIDIDGIAGKAIFICGIRRSGKTTLGVRIAEQLGKFNIPMLIPDLKGDWLSCVNTLPNAVILGQGEATEDNAKAHGYAICEEQIQIILDITSYDDMNEVAMIIANMIDGIFLWERKHPEDRRLCAVFQDEMQSFLPQNVNDSIIPDATARDAMMNAHMRVIAVGGSLGLFPVTLTQRIAQTNNKVIGQPELMFLFKQKMDSDFNRYKNFTNVSVDQIKALGQGQGIFVSYEGDSSIHAFHKRTSSDAMSATPRYNPNPGKPAPKTRLLEDEDVDAYEEEPLPKLPVRPSLRNSVPARASKYERALAAWNAGNKSSRKLAQALGISKDKAWRAIQEMKNLGLIQESEESL